MLSIELGIKLGFTFKIILDVGPWRHGIALKVTFTDLIVTTRMLKLALNIIRTDLIAITCKLSIAAIVPDLISTIRKIGIALRVMSITIKVMRITIRVMRITMRVISIITRVINIIVRVVRRAMRDSSTPLNLNNWKKQT